MRRVPAGTLLGALLFAGCGAEPPTVISIESPAGAGSLAPRWSAPPGQAPLLSWLEPVGDGHALRYARLVAGEFSTPVTVATGTDWFVNWADTPSVVLLPGGSLAAHWLEMSGPGTYHYDLRVTISGDAGASWAPAFTAHEDGTQSEHGFAQLFPDAGALGAVWLDGRFTAHGGPMTLRYGRFLSSGAREAGTELDAAVCDCCMTGVARTDAGLVVVYRDRTKSEVRDILRVVRTEEGWSEPAPVADDGWEIAACPVNGPAVAAAGDRVAVTWFSAAGGEPVVKLAFSDDAGRSFGQPMIVDATAPAGRVDVAMAGDGGAWVSWLDGDAEPGRIMLRRFDPDGPGSDAVTVTELGTGRASGFPVMAPDGGSLVLAWTEPDSGIRLARVEPHR